MRSDSVTSVFHPTWQMIVEALILSLPMLTDVVFLAVFYMCIFGIACTELFMGLLRNRCGAPDFTYAYEDENGGGLMVSLRNVGGAP